jgi:hypothetical protein
LAEREAVTTPARVPSWPWWLLRGSVTLQAIAATVQPIFIGAFLSGDYDMLALHRINGTLVGAISLVQIVVAVLAWRVGRAPRLVMTSAVIVTVAVVVQIIGGFSRTLALHVPLGVVILGMITRLLVLAWRGGPARPGRPRTAT